MGGQWQAVPINMGGSIDTKTDPKTVVAGRFLSARDVVYTAIDQAAKRNGYKAVSSSVQGGTSLMAPQLTHNFQGDLLIADQSQLLTYSKELQSSGFRGQYVSVDCARQVIDGAFPSEGDAEVAVLGNYALYTWATIYDAGNTYGNPTSGAQAFAGVKDLNSNTWVLGPQLIYTAPTIEQTLYPRAVVLGGTTLAVIWIHYGMVTPDMLQGMTVTFPSFGNIAFSSVVNIAAAFDNGDLVAFECVATATGAVVAAGGSIATLNTALAITNSATSTMTRDMCICVDPSTGNIWIYGYNSGIQVEIYDQFLGVIQSATTMDTTLGQPYSMTAFAVSSTSQKLFVGAYVKIGVNGVSPSDVLGPGSYIFTVPKTGWPQTLTPQLFQAGAIPWSRPFTVTGNVGTQGGVPTTYAVFLGGVSQTQGDNQTFFVLRIGPGIAPAGGSQYVAARFGSGDAITNSGPGAGSTGFIPSNVAALSATKFLYAYGQAAQILALPAVPSWLDGSTFVNTYAMTFDFNSPRNYRAVNAGKLAILNGGCVHAYDGKQVTEFGFHMKPVITGITFSNVSGGGLVAAQSYQWQAIYQWIDGQGNQHQSEPSDVFQVEIPMSMNAATIYVTAPWMSQKLNVNVAIFRTPALSGGEGTAWFQVSDPAFPLIPSGTDAYVSLIDGFSDTQIQSALVPYTSPISPVLANTTPPPSMVMTPRTNRLWLLNAENPNEEWYTKQYTAGVGLSPSGFLLNEIDPKLGEITAMAEMDEKLVSFTGGQPFVQTGDGADDTGANATLTQAQPVPSDVGCDNLKSLIETPEGILFHSPNGIYMLDRALGVTYRGMDVEAYNAQQITKADLIPGKSQIRFLCSSGFALVYDYIFNKWALFTNHTGLSSTIWQGGYVYAQGAFVLQETQGWYLDNLGASIAPAVETSWLNLAGVQGFERTRLLELLGDFINGASTAHGVQVSAAYDFSTTYTALDPFTFGAAAASGTFQERVRFVTQKCDTISLLIQEIATGDSAEYVDFTNMSFEAMIKKGLRKLPTTQMVG